ncbi:hypothetical protein [Sphingomonas sp. 3-13AW]|uniref:hypothetical protein n=1 Tax=Sphingomonas sp. 3-13AW TaxID=3050450 RepID=UPI003BB6492E
MPNHPNRTGGRPKIPADQQRRTYALRLDPDVYRAANDAGRAKIEAILKAALL